MTIFVDTNQTGTYTVATSETHVFLPGVVFDQSAAVGTAVNILNTGAASSGTTVISSAYVISGDTAFAASSDATLTLTDQSVTIGKNSFGNDNTLVFAGLAQAALTGNLDHVIDAGTNNTINVSGVLNGTGPGSASASAIRVFGTDNAVAISGDVHSSASGVIVQNERNTVTVSGTIDGGIHGIWSRQDQSTRTEIQVSGSVAGAQNGIKTEAQNASINVTGTVTGGVQAVNVSGDNSRLTVGDGGSVYTTGPGVSVVATGGFSVIRNDGTIGTSGANVAIDNIQNFLSADGDTLLVNNAGTIFGNVELRDGEDFFTNIGAGIVDGVVNGGSGDDSLTGSNGDDVFNGGTGSDELYGKSGADTLNGGDDSDFLDGGEGADRLDSGSGDDVVRARDGEDTLYGRDGNDRLFGDSGDDTVLGGAGNDFLEGGDGADLVTGGAGDDTIQGGLGDDHLVGGDGVDLVLYNQGTNGVYINLEHNFAVGAEGYDAVNSIEIAGGTVFQDIIYGANNESNQLFGGDGDDFLYGLSGRDTLDGGEDNDMLYGGADVDRLFGAEGDDFLDGGLGTDFLFGGSGADTFVLRSVSDSGVGRFNRDEIRDFLAVEGDQISLALVDADATVAGDQAFIFAGSSFTGTPGELILNYNTLMGLGNVTIASMDVDGDGVADSQIQINGGVFEGDFVL